MKIATNNPALAELQFRLAKLGQGSMPATASAMKAGADYIQSRWREFALGGELQGVKKLERGSDGYARSIRTKKLGPFSHEIYSEAEIARRIEQETPELDMKQTHTKGPRSRRSESTGYPYVIIPFRWGTPGKNRVGFGKNVITAAAYKQMIKRKTKKSEGFKASTVRESPNTSTKQTPNASGEMVGRASYSWGSRLPTQSGDSMERNMSGMVRFENGYDGEGNIKKRYGGYFTFRIISANPKSPSFMRNAWVRPAQEARPVTRVLLDASRKFIDETVDAAIMEDLGL
jgi:hypothetical protein